MRIENWAGAVVFFSSFLQKSEKDGQEYAAERDDVVPADGLAFEHCGHDDGEHGEGDGLLDDFELHERERTSVDLCAYTVGGNHEAVLKKSQSPRAEDDEDKGPVGVDFQLGEFEVAVPGKSHKDIGAY